ncbi:hypothetical protein [Alkalilimnicola sp. S0819]|uniref:hypothetical protein n=1 Tax=Alkalilimnicola sp. S0819 TaxID=2613922 RepID=UPI0012614861|nr:hypothetical protein [Alkalilimnicola sp. S0819]KAB7623405.1 hypothetical protein F3N43_09920 [Alkalilimnicola sp. S0819]MPQ16951.1 hypothetical protein [Alkalilimnicola sp. S0819]
MLIATSPRGRRILRSPTVTLPLAWLMTAAALPGKSLALGLALLWLVRVRQAPTVTLRRIALARFSVSRDASYDALRRLERESLVHVRRRPGRPPEVTLLAPDGEPLSIT